MELLILIINKIISYQFLPVLLEEANHEQSSQINQSTWCFTLKCEALFQELKKGFYGRKNVFEQKIYRENILNRRTNDQIMPRRGRFGGGGVSKMINVFSNRLFTVNLHLKIKPWLFYKIMK